MAQNYFVGVFFLCGLVFGTILSTYFTDSRQYVAHPTDTYHTETERRQILARTVDNTSATSLAGITQELQKLQRMVSQMNTTNSEQKIIYINKPPMSHEEVDRIKGPDNPIHFGDEHIHKDDDHVAKRMFDEIRVLCWIMTAPDNLQKKAIHVKTSWAKRCNKVVFMSDVEDKQFPAVGLGTDLGREHLTAKTMRAFDYVYKNHFNDADWFMKADDDTYVIVENLRYMLSPHAPTEPVYFGHHFKVIVEPQGYFSGGAGYVMSKEALKRFANRTPTDCAVDHGAEDVEMGRCMQKLGVQTGDSRDKLGRSRFHCFNPETHLHGGYPDWYLKYDKYGADKGIESISDYPVSFHYVSVQQMYDLEFFIYHLGAYGIVNGLQELNGPVDEGALRKRLLKGAPTSTTSTSTSTTTTTAAPVQQR